MLTGVFPKGEKPAMIFNSLWVEQFLQDGVVDVDKLKRWLKGKDVPWHQIEIFHFAVNRGNFHFFLASACKHDLKVRNSDRVKG